MQPPMTTDLTLNLTAASQVAEVDTTKNNVATRTAEKIEALGFDVQWFRETKVVTQERMVRTHRNAVGFTESFNTTEVRWSFEVYDWDTAELVGVVSFWEGSDHTTGGWGFTNGLKELLASK